MTRILVAITLLLSIILTILVTIFYSVPIIIAGIVKLLLPVPIIWREVSRSCDFVIHYWCEDLTVLLHLNPHLQQGVHGPEGLSRKSWYLLICSHRSWADTVVLYTLFRRHIPMNKYLLKQQLAWVPFPSLARWMLDMSLIERYSHAYLLRHPERRGRDVETTRRSCEKFHLRPATTVNFAESSRFTQERHQQTHSAFQNLLPPKAAGITMMLNILGKQFDKLLNVTLCYSDNNRQSFFDMLSGKLTRIVVHVDLQPIANGLHGDYINDGSFKRHPQQWLNSLWQEKDRLLTSLMLSQRQGK